MTKGIWIVVKKMFLATTLIATILLSACSGDDSPESISRAGVFETTAGTAIIEGELFLPIGEGPFPAMIIIAGSGNEPRAEFEPIAQTLTQNGYALYIFDKRGVGGSTGSYPAEGQPTQLEFLNARADDVLSIIDLLKSHTLIDNERIGLFGSSQGAWVNSVVHGRSNDLAYIVMASGGVASTGLEMFFCDLTDDPNISIEEAHNQLANFTGPVGYDPISTIESMTLPVLWIYGEEDRSHPARYDVEVLEGLNRPNFTVQVYANMDHDLLDLTTRQTPVNLYPALGQWLGENN